LFKRVPLHMDQGIRVAGQFLVFLPQFAPGVESAHISEISSSGSGKQAGVADIHAGCRWGAAPIHRAEIDEGDRPVMFQQRENKRFIPGLTAADHSQQVAVQATELLVSLCHRYALQWVALFIDGPCTMMAARPVNVIPSYYNTSLAGKTQFLNSCVLLPCRSQRHSLMSSPVQKSGQGRSSILHQASRVGELASALCRGSQVHMWGRRMSIVISPPGLPDPCVSVRSRPRDHFLCASAHQSSGHLYDLTNGSQQTMVRAYCAL
jgi:hypothetical protein